MLKVHIFKSTVHSAITPTSANNRYGMRHGNVATNEHKIFATSLDGFIARSHSALDWLNEANATVLDGEDFGFQALMDSVDALIMGR